MKIAIDQPENPDDILKVIIDKIKQIDGVDVVNVPLLFGSLEVPEGRPPHYDYGYDADGEPDYHMAWCKYSASALMSNDHEGGEFLFLTDNNKIIDEYDKKKHYKKILIYSVDNKHMVKPTIKGHRIVNLFFFKLK